MQAREGAGRQLQNKYKNNTNIIQNNTIYTEIIQYKYKIGAASGRPHKGGRRPSAAAPLCGFYF